MKKLPLLLALWISFFTIGWVAGGCAPSGGRHAKYATGDRVLVGDIVHVNSQHASVDVPLVTVVKVKIMNEKGEDDTHWIRPEYFSRCNPKSCELK